ncbi:MAG: PKD domain-containing protein, partial [Methanosarcina mazei]|nr:PKD domain-containing protein [Methanosarcina mazei]
GTTGTKPVLQYWGSPRSGTAPLTVTFKDNSSGSPTAWNWSFGDGAYSNEKYPKHTLWHQEVTRYHLQPVMQQEVTH